MNVFFLVVKDFIGHVVESVWWQLVLLVHMYQHVQLDTTINIYLFCVSVAHNLWLKSAVLDFWKYPFTPSEHTVIAHFQMLGPFQNVVQVKVYHIVASDKIRIVSDHKFFKVKQQVLLIVRRLYMNAWDFVGSMKGKNHSIVFFDLVWSLADTCDLNDLVFFWVRESVLSCAFDIEWEDSEWRHFHDLTQSSDVFSVALNLKLAFWYHSVFLFTLLWIVFFFLPDDLIVLNLHPAHPNQLLINHEP